MIKERKGKRVLRWVGRIRGLEGLGLEGRVGSRGKAYEGREKEDKNHIGGSGG